MDVNNGEKRKANGQFDKGRRKGRPPGSPNKVTRTVKQAVEESLNSGKGATAFFDALKKSSPKTFAQVAAKLIPNEVNAKIEGNVTLKVVSGVPDE